MNTCLVYRVTRYYEDNEMWSQESYHNTEKEARNCIITESPSEPYLLFDIHKLTDTWELI